MTTPIQLVQNNPLMFLVMGLLGAFCVVWMVWTFVLPDWVTQRPTNAQKVETAEDIHTFWAALKKVNQYLKMVDGKFKEDDIVKPNYFRVFLVRSILLKRVKKDLELKQRLFSGALEKEDTPRKTLQELFSKIDYAFWS